MIDAGTAATLIVNTENQAVKSAARLANMSLANQAKSLNDAQLNQVSQDFESMFVSQMLEQMFGDSIGNDLFGDEETKEIYKGLLMEEYGKQIVQSGGIGIAAYVKAELLKLQEAAI